MGVPSLVAAVVPPHAGAGGVVPPQLASPVGGEPPPAAAVPFQIQTLPAPPAPSLCVGQEPPPGHVVAAYEQWLTQQEALLSSQKKALEGDVGKLRKAKKALSTKQRQLAKNGQELPQHNALELHRIAQQQPGMQKNLDQVGHEILSGKKRDFCESANLVLGVGSVVL